MSAPTGVVREWIGRGVQDPYGEPLGVVVGGMHDRETGVPEWLIVAPDGSADAMEGALVPVCGASATGRQIRVVALADAVRSAPVVRVGDELAVEEKRAAAAHYGLALDHEASPTGQLREPPATAPEPAGPAPLATASPEQRRQIVRTLQQAHALEQASLKQLDAMRWRAHDEELVHDVTLHHKETNEHAARLRERLRELGAQRARPVDWAGKLAAYVDAKRGRLRRETPEAADARKAYDFEQAEIALYDRLERLAVEAGDERTAELARRIRADEQAMACSLAASRMWADPGRSRERPSPFEPPQELDAAGART